MGSEHKDKNDAWKNVFTGGNKKLHHLDSGVKKPRSEVDVEFSQVLHQLLSVLRGAGQSDPA